MKSHKALVLIVPIILGILFGCSVSSILKERAIREMEEQSHMRREQMLDPGDVEFGYAVLGFMGGAFLGMLVGVFAYAVIKNRDSDKSDQLSLR
jgi:hypothetical protein